MRQVKYNDKIYKNLFVEITIEHRLDRFVHDCIADYLLVAKTSPI